MSLRSKLDAGEPVITVELSPPKGTDVARLLSQAESLKGRVDAINIPDCQLSMLKMSSLAASKLIQDATGIEAVWQLTCRDRNLIALQADILGGYALGLRNILALTGDPGQIGDQKAPERLRMPKRGVASGLRMIMSIQIECRHAHADERAEHETDQAAGKRLFFEIAGDRIVDAAGD